MWIKREISSIWHEIKAQPARILVGPRQAGKSSFLDHIKEPDFQSATLDDINFRDLASRDPQLFVDQLGQRFIIDEAQYAPNLFPELKKRIDLYKQARRHNEATKEPAYWLTGSNRVLLDRQVSESLTGRATYFRLHTLSAYEMRQAGLPATLENMLFRGGWPELYVDPTQDAVSYLNDHIDTTLVKDLVHTVGIIKVNEFIRFLRLLSGRVGSLFVASEMARDAGVKGVTITEWTSFVERMMYGFLIPSYQSSLTTRLIKAPKFFFADVSLATRLQGWSTFQPLLVSPQIGHLFENLVLCEIMKARDNHLLSWEISHLRTKEKEEIDFIVASPTQTLAIEAKLSSREAAAYSPPAGVAKIKHLRHAVVSLEGGKGNAHVDHIALPDLRDYLLKHLR